MARLVAALVGAYLILAGPSLLGRARFVTYSEVQDVLAVLTEILPPALRHTGTAPADAWAAWTVEHDRAIRARLERGDQDTIVNWLLFGTSFTKRPRAFVDVGPTKAGPDGADLPGASPLGDLIAGRAADLVQALTMPGSDERRLLARALLGRMGYRVTTADDRTRLQQRLLIEVARVAREQATYAREIEDVRRLADVSEQFAVRSRLFRDRGLSLDTSIRPSFALEVALQRIIAAGLIKPASIRRAAVIGPGLDFTDKAGGYDVYPQQTLQPFAFLDTLMRLGLSDRTAGVRLTTFDISPRVNDHLARARTRARSGTPYVLQLPLDAGTQWTADVKAYWQRLGDRIGVATRGTAPQSVTNVDVRTVLVRPAVALEIAPEDLDIVVQRFDGPPFDLVVATNIFVYYDTLDQSLALASVHAMLRPGGLLLSNNALLELPALRMRSAGYVTVPYSDRSDDGDHIVWYQRAVD